MTWLAALQSMLPAPERRSREQIDDDLDAEFAFHLEQSAGDLMREDGLDADAARSVARDRFGNIDTIKKRCQRIALEERIMLQRINAVLMAFVILMLIGVSVQMFLTQRSNASALADLTRQVGQISSHGGKAAIAANSASSERRHGYIYIDGKVKRPGTYSLPPLGQLTVRRLIATAGGLEECPDPKVTVTSLSSDGTTQERFKSERFSESLSADFMLAPDDHVHVECTAQTVASEFAPPGTDAGRDRKRADALYDFVKTLMIEVGVENAGNHAKIRQILDKMQADLPAKYPNDPDVQGLIAEMIQGRRKILEYDEQPISPGGRPVDPAASQARDQASMERLRAETEHAKVQALNKFLASVLSTMDPSGQSPIDMRQLLDDAAQKADREFAGNPSALAQIRATIAEARMKLEAQAAVPATQPVQSPPNAP